MRRKSPPVDITNPAVDISSYLLDGENSVVLKTVSTLWNSVIPIWDKLLTGGVEASFSVVEIEELLGYGAQDYGILRKVQVVPY